MRLRMLIATLAASVTSVSAANLSASLSEDEHQFAASTARVQAWSQKGSGTQRTFQRATQPVIQKNSNHLLDTQTLSIELDEVKKNNKQRRARVYQFNYNTQQSRLILIDLDTRDVVKTQPIESIHLPLNQHEIATARTLIEEQPELMDELSQEQQSRGLPVLNDLSGIDVKASIFEPNDSTHPCAKQRCALMSLFDHTRTVFAVEPLVNLQVLSVTTLQKSF